MTNALRPRTLFLFLGDLVFFAFSLWLSLFVRAFELPTRDLFLAHLAPFSLLFLAWVIVFFIAGLYESRSIILERRAISATLLIAQIINLCLAALFFFFIPIFGIAPKTLLIIYLAVSFLLVLAWRTLIFPRLTRPEKAIIVGSGKEVDDLAEALNHAHRAPARIVQIIRPNGAPVAEATAAAIAAHRPRFIIADFNNKDVAAAFPELYNYILQGVRFFDAISLYEEVFGRIALSYIDDRWIARNVSRYSHTLYDSLKRVMDVVIALPAFIISLVLYPFIGVIIKLQDGGHIFYRQMRIGENGRAFAMLKFRSMTGADQGSEVLKSKHRVTAFGRFLRKSRIDELPQLWSVVRGDLSLIGPRPEFPALVHAYEKEIPYYGIRHLIKPGLSGWAQLYHDNHPHHGAEVEATREKFSYDLYYLKHRSLMLDAIIVLKTLKKLLTRSGA